VVIAAVGALLAVPRAVEPRDLPLPIPDARAIATLDAREAALARAIVPELERELADTAAGTKLYDLRAFGDAFREYGRAEARGDVNAVVKARQRLLESVLRARALGDDKLLGVRAYQKDLFVVELRRWEDTGTPSAELAALGGTFGDLATRDGWLARDGRSLEMDDVLRGIFFKRRWNELTGLTAGPYELSLDEQRAFHAFLLKHPYVEGNDKLGAADACRAADQWRLRKIEDLARVDSAYPYALARGVLLYRLGRYPAAAQSFRDHLATADGRFALRARNYLLAAVTRLNDER
jgi:hypothetical protein